MLRPSWILQCFTSDCSVTFTFFFMETWILSPYLAFLPATIISYLCDFGIVSCIGHLYRSWTLRNGTFIFFVGSRIVLRTAGHRFLTWGWRSTGSCFALQHGFFPVTFVPVTKGSVYLWNQCAINKYLKCLIWVTILLGEVRSILWSNLWLIFWISQLIYFSSILFQSI